MRNRFKTLLAVLMALSMLVAWGCANPAVAPEGSADPIVAATPAPTAPAVEEPAAPVYVAGTYEATVTAHNAPITLAVTVSEDAITDVAVTSDFETIGVGKVALEAMTERIVAQQSLACDVVSGASITSYAVLNAAEQCLVQAGADIAALKAAPAEQPAADEEYTADVVVVGGGGAGLAAAIGAMQEGASVIVVEKLDFLGGSTNVSEGALNAVDPVRQGAQGIEDSVEKFIQQTYDGGHKVGDMELISFMCNEAMGTVEWMETLGVEFKAEVGTATGALWQRSHYPVTPSGNSYIRVFQQVLEASDKAQILYGTKATDLIAENGEVFGVTATGKDGQKVTLRANKGVVLATGGFGSNKQMLAEANTGVWSHVDLTKLGCTNLSLSATGDGIVMAQAIGADVVGMSDIQLHPCGTPGTGLMEHIRTSGRNRIFANIRGERFVNEGAARDTLAQAILDQDEQTYWIVVNAIRYPSRDFVDSNGSTIENMVAQGVVIEADTLAALAEKTGMDATKLQASIDGYNAVVRGEVEDSFGFKADNQADKELTEGPWYACKKVVTVHHTMGGLKVNVDSEVQNAEGATIPGLFACGEITGGLHGSNRLGGNAIADCMTYGHSAGRLAANNPAR